MFLQSNGNSVNGLMAPHTVLNTGCFKRALQWYSKCYCVATVTKRFALSVVQGVEQWIVHAPLSANVFITLATP
jgi:hypothetical protein